ncbi:MAG TPA: S8 family serine peptidase [Candidatus Limnocylindria bacterium]
MSRALSTVLALLVVVAGALPIAAADEKAPLPDTDAPPTVSSTGEVVPGEVIVKFRDPERGPALARARGLATLASVGEPAKGLPAVVSTAGRPVDQVLVELRADPNVEYAEPSYRVQLVEEGATTAVGVNDPLTAGQYSLDQMRVRDAWSLSKGGTGVVAVLDTGVMANHTDLSGRVLAGYDFVNDDSNAADDNGHGTWVAGIIAAKPNDGYGIAGISWSDKILPVKIMTREGTGSTSDLIAGIRWAADHGATVINMSVGGFPYTQGVQDAINYAWGKGVVLVGAAGNNNRDETFYPASMANVVSVSATQVNDEFSYWSSYGSAVDVSAPGSSVQTTNCTVCTYADHHTWGAHTYISGTSFATPNVAGVVALIRARYPSFTPQQVVDRLIGTVDDRGPAGWDKRYGRGRVNAYRALGASVAATGLLGGDAFEGNNSLAAARVIPLGTATRPSIYPAGDVDFFAVNVPRAGRLDVRVSGVVDTRAYPWNKSSLKIDPIVELYTTGGTLLRRVDAVWENGTELAQTTVAGPGRIVVRVRNYFANGNRSAYAVTPTYVDTAAPALSARSPAPGALGVSYDGPLTVTFNEAVVGVSTSSMVLRTASNASVGSTVTYDAAARRATLRPTSPLAGEQTYSLTLTSGIKDPAGNAMPPTSWTFTTGKTAPRVWGDDRYATATALSRTAFGVGVPVAYVATGATFPDALAGAPVARLAGGPILLVEKGSVPAVTAAELNRLKPGRIVVLGGPSVVAESVLTALDAFTPGSVTRVAGADRYATAAQISRSAFASASLVYVVTGETYPDALSAGTVAAARKAPLLLVRAGSIPSSTLAELGRLDPDRIMIVGSTGVVGSGVASQLAAFGQVTRVSGPDRYATSAALSAASFATNGPGIVYVATGKTFPDGLTAGPIAGMRNGPLLLVSGSSLPAVVATELRRLDPTNIVIVGGPNAVTDSVRNQIRALWP